MRSTGTLLRWNHDRGFGFIAPSQGGTEVFVHISAFPRDGARPTVGDKLSYELGHGKNGKPQAVNVVRLSAVGRRSTHRSAPGGAKKKPAFIGTVLTLALLAGVGTWGYREFSESQRRLDLAEQPATVLGDPDSTSSTATFSCDGRTHCSQMTSCEEATWFINHCPGTQMDGNNDGTPCELQWCKGP